MNRAILILPYLLIVLMISCESKINIEGLNSHEWKSDSKGCNRKRERILEALIKEKNKLKGLNENDILGLFGKPDEQELGNRSLKYYTYFINPSTECESNVSTFPKILQIRFNSIGRANEILIKGYSR